MAGAGTKRIVDLTETSEVQSGDYIAIDSTARGTKKTPASIFAKAADLTAEQTARQQADTTLDGKITAEAQARAEAISDEQTAREEADDDLTESITALSDEVTAQGALIQNPTKTVSGEVAHFTDGAEMPAKSLIVNIEPQQSGTGTPSPDNVRQISGWESVNVFDTGVNVWDEEWESGGLSTAGAETVDSTKIRNKGYIAVKPNATYYGIAPSTLAIRFYDASKTFVGTANGTNREFTAPSNAYYLRFFITATTYNHDISINYPATDTEYHAYNPNSSTTTVNLGRTVYGADAEIVGGSLTDKMAMVTFDGSSEEAWVKDTDTTSPDGVVCFRAYLQNDSIKKPEGTAGTIDYIGRMFSNTMPTLKNGYVNQYPVADTVMGVTGYSGAINNYFYIIVNKTLSSIQSVTELRAWLAENPTTVVYELAEPQTYQLTPTEVKTLLGENNVWADAGAVEVTYRRDINLALEQLEALLNS